MNEKRAGIAGLEIRNHSDIRSQGTGLPAICYSGMMKQISTLSFVLSLLSLPALAQTLPPTAQQLQQQSGQAIQNESATTHNNLSQTQQQVQGQAQQPTLNRSGRAVAHPPGYIPMPR